jgi:hypothetical protein
MNSIVHIPATYRFREAEREAEAAAANQTSAIVAQAPPEETPADLDGALAALDDCLRKLDQLTERAANFPSELKTIEDRHEALSNQEVDSVAAIESRSAEAAKLGAMKELATVRQKKLKNSIAAQTAAVVKIGGQAAGLAEQLFWSLQTAAITQAEGEFSRLFFHAYEHRDLLLSYKPVVLLGRLKIPDILRTRALDTQLTRCRQLRGSVDRLRQFSAMSFEEISVELELQDRESRERAQQVRKIGSEQVS